MQFLLLIFTIAFFLFPVAETSAEEQLSSLDLYLSNIPIYPASLVIASGICPQLRKTKKAPSKYALKKNPLFATAKNIERGKLLYPYSIIVLEDNTLLVTEFGNNRLQQFNTNGESLGIWGKAGDSEGSFKTPWGAVRVQGGVLVIDTGNNRLQLLNGFMM